MEDLAAISAKEVKRVQQERKGVFLCRWTVRINVNSKVMPTSFLEVEEKRKLIGAGKWERDTIKRTVK